MYRPKKYFSFFAMMAYSVSQTLHSCKNSILNLIKKRNQIMKIVLISNKLKPLYQSKHKQYS